MNIFEEIADALVSGKSTQVEKLTLLATQQQFEPKDILNNALLKGMSIVGNKFKNNEYFVPEVLVSAKSMHAGMEILKPLLAKQDAAFKGKILIGTVRGDLHDIGKNLVIMMLEGAGYQIINLGIDVPADIFVEKTKSENPDIVAMSALLTTTMLAMNDTIKAFQENGLRNKIKIIIGGAPVTQKYAEQIGADGFAPDAISAVEMVNALL